MLANESSAALLPLFTSGLGQSFLGSLFESCRLEGERARFGCNGSAHGTLSESSASASAGTKARLATLLVKACIDCTVGISFLDSRVNTIRLQSILKGIDSISHLIFGILQLFLSYNIEFLSLFEVELKLFAFAVTLAFLILFPVFDTLLMPLLHETCVALKFIDLNAPHFLFTHGSHLLIIIITSSGEVGLTVQFLIKLQKMGLHIELLLGLVESIDTDLEKLVLHTVIFLLGIGNFLCRLVITKLSSFGKHGNICDRVNLFQAHFQLVQKSQCQSTIPFHDLVDHLRVELDIQVSKRGLKFLKILQTV